MLSWWWRTCWCSPEQTPRSRWEPGGGCFVIIDANLGPENADSFHRDLHKHLKANYLQANPLFNSSDWEGERSLFKDTGGYALYFGIGIMTYNFFVAQKLLTMPEYWRSKTIKSIRWLLADVGGKFIRHGRSLTLKVATTVEKFKIYLEMRRKTYELRLEWKNS